jgi:protein-S-isoprenylcysteine O-methyltransferase Ste14
MGFPKRYAEIAARARVPAGFLVAVLFVALARPTWLSLAIGGAIAMVGLALRAWAAGHLAKYERLSTSGPFAHLRNPLYLGTLIVGSGFAVAGAHVGIGVLLVAFFVMLYLPVIEEEENYLRKKFPEYTEYQQRVPRLWPRLSRQGSSRNRFRSDLYLRNQEYQALAGFLAVKGRHTPAVGARHAGMPYPLMTRKA